MNSTNPEECVLCCRDIEIYATGACDHPVCYECSTRMRVLCETNECPICRSDMPVVVFMHQIEAFSNVFKKFTRLDRKYRILFQDDIIWAAFDRLLENKCKSCKEVTANFTKLQQHVRREHELHYCDLCTESLRIFTFERKCYTRKDLARHRKEGDPDETSHRGHPACQFCDIRYIDSDDLYRHLRREHYWCHFCEADGKHDYYKDYDYLRVHFRKDHYLCEEDNCINEKFTAAFVTEIDLKAHIATHHSKNKSRQEVKQARVLEFEFPYAPHPRHVGNSSPRGGRFSQQRRRNEDDNPSRDRNKTIQKPEIENLNMQSVQEFPYLSDETTGVTPFDTKLNSFGRNVPQQRRNVMAAEDFPALCPSNTPVASEDFNNQVKNLSLSQQNRPAAVTLQKNVPKQTFNSASEDKKYKKDESDRGDRVNPNPKWIGKRSNLNFEEEFPTLEVKKNPMPVAIPVPKTTSIIQNNASSNRLADTNTEPSFGDQFVIIKGKSKKKRQNKIPAQLDNDKDEDFSSKLPYFNGKNIGQTDQEDPFKKHLVHPLASYRPPAKMKEHWEEEVSFGKEDFPPLAPSEPVKKPPGFNIVKIPVPPPGFSANPNITKPVLIHKTLSATVREIVMPSQNKQNGTTNLMEYSFVKPQDFNSRNNELIKKISEIIDNEEIFPQFKSVSGSFRDNKISAAEYHTQCLEILGLKGFLEIFPELVSLLPYIKKQQELFTVHNEFLSQLNGGAISKKTTRASPSVVSCDKCNQVLVVHDCTSHARHHDLEIIQ